MNPLVISGSIASTHTAQLEARRHRTPEPRDPDGFSFRHDVETGTAQTRPPFDQVLMALGYPNSSPEQYFKYSVMYHLEGLPPLCLLHGNADELSSFSQTVELAQELETRGMPYEFYGYEGLTHYFATTADNATTQQMFQDSVDCLRRALESE